MADGLNLNVITFGSAHDCMVRATDVEIREGRPHFDLITPAGRTTVGLRLIGAHQVANALAVASVGHALGISLDVIAGSLSTAEPSSKWRMELHELQDLLIINDSYNANPDSMAAALQTLALFAQERGGSAWAFLSTMHELGESESKDHQEIGRVCVELGIDHVVCVGEPRFAVAESETTKFHQAKSKDEALSFMAHVAPGDVI
jgi:UDP-N-acetylmuramoyl-tripeptide--D-alanyl-D-alanine ligase